MVRSVRWAAVVVIAVCAAANGRPVAAMGSADPICDALRSFAGSVKAGESKTFAFRTAWGGGFKGTRDSVLFETRCEDFGHGPGTVVCQALMKHGSIEFSGKNPLRAITCLTHGFPMKDASRLNRIDIEIPYGSDEHGSTVAIKFDDDKEVGGELLSITAVGY
jgi:hypothetical protein